ncbi:hypothetical protein G6F45_000795 [Rhizopus arrhizus]|nr:hypothetical protein G6F45_000795 [Rhizopus arrhizus]
MPSNNHFADIAQKVLNNKHASEKHSEAHQTLRSYPGNENRGEVSKQQGNIHGITHPGSTGVIYVMDRAKKSGYNYDDKEWSNFGQGAPEGGG